MNLENDGDLTPGTNSNFGIDLPNVKKPVNKSEWGKHGTRYDEPCANCHRETEIDNDTELCQKCGG